MAEPSKEENYLSIQEVREKFEQLYRSPTRLRRLRAAIRRAMDKWRISHLDPDDLLNELLVRFLTKRRWPRELYTPDNRDPRQFDEDNKVLMRNIYWLCRDFRNKRESRETHVEIDDQLVNGALQNSSHFGEVSARLDIERLEHALSDKPIAQRILRLKYEHGCSEREISELTGLGMHQIKSATRAITRERDRMAEEGLKP